MSAYFEGIVCVSGDRGGSGDCAPSSSICLSSGQGEDPTDQQLESFRRGVNSHSRSKSASGSRGYSVSEHNQRMMQDFGIMDEEPQHGGEDDVPQQRFGHTTTVWPQRDGQGDWVLLFGGATGSEGTFVITADTHIFDIHSATWQNIDADGQVPSARAAHAAAYVESSNDDGGDAVVIYGGATGGGTLSEDILYLLKFDDHKRSFAWEKVLTDGATPGRRYGHSMTFNGPLLIVFGGNNGQQALDDIWTFNIDAVAPVWSNVAVQTERRPLPRVYHSADICRSGPAAGMMVVFGGRTSENRSLKDIWGLRQHRDGAWDWVEAPTKSGAPPQPRFQHTCLFDGNQLLVVGGRGSDVNKVLPTSVYDTEQCCWRSIAPAERFRHSCWLARFRVDGEPRNKLFCYGGFRHQEPSLPTNTLQSLWVTEHLQMAENGNSRNVDGMMVERSKETMRGTDSGCGPQIKMSGTVEVSCEGGADPIRKLTLGQLEVEGKKLEGVTKVALTNERQGQGVEDKVIAALLRPQEWQPPHEDDPFCITRHEVFTLCENVERILQKEPMCLQLRAPIKVFGDIHGQFSDLMRLFARYKCPRDGDDGDIDAVDYLFLGDYVDRGCHSLEVICLLFALKLKFPRQIHLIRGNHEDPTINAVYGFWDECCRRLGDDPNNPEDEQSCWMRFNRVFEWMPCTSFSFIIFYIFY